MAALGHGRRGGWKKAASLACQRHADHSLSSRREGAKLTA